MRDSFSRPGTSSDDFLEGFKAHMAENSKGTTARPDSKLRPAKYCVYCSRIDENFELYAGLHTGLDKEELAQAVRNRDPKIDMLAVRSASYKLGRKLVGEQIPNTFFAQKHQKISKLPEVFLAGGFVILRSKCAELFRRFNFGQNSLEEVDVFQNDRKTRVDGEFYFLNFGEYKDTLLVDQSEGLRVFGRKQEEQMWQSPSMPSDDQIVLGQVALQGSDMWHEKRLHLNFFISQRLKDALEQEGIAKPFNLFRCKVMESNDA